MPLFLSFLHCTPFIFPVEKNSVIDSADIVSHRVMQLMHVPPNVTSRSPLLIATVAALIILTIMTSSYTIFQDKWISFNLLSCHPKRGLRPLKHRNLMGNLLEEYGFKTGVEVGVKQGAYAKIVLGQWKSCRSYKLVDPWRHQENYVDIANVDQETQDRVEVQLEMLRL